jgi:AcrR family transcriptional regulator
MIGPARTALTAPVADLPAAQKLRPGPGLSRAAVAADQRLRLRAALLDLIAEVGYEAVTVRALIRRAGISTSTFYKLYSSVDACFAAIVESTIRGAAEEIREDPDPGDGSGRLSRGLRRLMDRLGGEPYLARAVFIEASGAGPTVQGEMDTSLRELERAFAVVLDRAPRPAVGSTHLAAGLVAGVVRIVRKTALTERAEELPALVDQLTDWMLSVAHEEVVAFRLPRSRPANGMVGVRLPWIGAVPASRESVADSNRRAVLATARLAASDGVAGLTGTRIRKDAGLSRSEFDKHFSGVEHCFLDAVESICEMAASAAELAAADARSWERRMYKTIAALTEFAASDREICRLVLHDITTPGPHGLLRREGLIGRCAEYVLRQAPVERRPSELAADASISAIWRIAETEVSAGRAGELPRVAPVFAYMLLAPRRSNLNGQPVAVA